MISTRRCPAPAGTAPSSSPAAAEAGAVAVLTDPAGRAAAVAAGLPVLVVDDPRAVLGAVASAVYGDPTGRLTVIGITGTAGKTSTAYLVESGLRAAGLTTGLIGTVETRLGDLVIDSVRTTPEATDLHAMLAAARRARRHRGGDGGVQPRAGDGPGRRGPLRGRRLHQLRPRPPRLPRRRRRLLRGQGASCSTAAAGVEVLNLDEPALRPLLQAGHGHLLGRRRPGGDLVGRPTSRPTAFGQRFIAHGPAGRGRRRRRAARPAQRGERAARPRRAGRGRGRPGDRGRRHRRLPGRAGPARAGRPRPATCSAWSTTRTSRTRSSPRWPRCASWPPARGGRLICVIGAGGDRDRGKRPLMGAAAAARRRPGDRHRRQPAHRGPGGDPGRGAAPAPSAAGAAAKIIEVAGRRAAIDEAVRLAGPGDVVAVLGKGHERGQEVDGEMLPFDDRVELAAALTARRRGGAAHDPHDAGRDRRGRPAAGWSTPTRPRPSPAPVEYDSRKVGPGGLFVAFDGEKVDGHDFAAAAVDGRRGRRCSAPGTPAEPGDRRRRPAGGAGRAGPRGGRPAART